MRRQCHWVALATGCIIAGGAILLTWLLPAGQLAIANELVDCGATADAFCGAATCGCCHPDNQYRWADSLHASAAIDARFRVRLLEESDPGRCYQCHTTGYDPLTGRFEQAGVTCESCHGPYQHDHSEGQMAIADPTAICGQCHSGTLEAWRNGLHPEAKVEESASGCTDCHPAHVAAPPAGLQAESS